MALPEFRNEPFTDFTTEPGRAAMLEALRLVGAELGKEFPLVIGGKRVTTKEKFTSLNPSEKTEVVAVCQKATPEHVRMAVTAADEAFKTWSRVPAEERAGLPRRAAGRRR